MKKIIITTLLLTALIGLSTNAQISQNGLVAYYPFNGNANDESGNGLNGTVEGAILTIDRFGNQNSAYSFTTNQDIIVPNTESLNVYPLSISLWYKVDSLKTGDNGNIFSKYVPTAWNGFQIVYADNRNVPNKGEIIDNGFGVSPWYLRNGNDRLIGYYNEPPFLQQNISSNTWYHYVFVVDDTGGKLYVNGQLIDTHSWTGSPGPSTCSYLWKIGGFYDNWFHGKIDDIGIWNRVLSSTEIQQLYSACSTSAPTGSASQTLCSGSTIAELTATGTNVQWYSESTGGTSLASTTALVSGTTYFASQTVNGCESASRLGVTVSLNNPTISATATTICEGSWVSLTANNNLASIQIQTQVNNLVSSGLWSLLVTYNNHYYLQYQTRMTWPQAKVLCEQNGGYMYCVNSQLENDNVSVPIANSQVYGDFLLGLYQDTASPNYSEPAGGWKWLDGSIFSYTNWAQNQPSGGSENYGIMDWNNMGSNWNDTYDNINGTVIMEYLGNSSYLWSTSATTPSIIVSPTSTTQYWVDVTTNGVTCRKYVNITVNSTTTPTGENNQTMVQGSTLANLSVTGQNILWYSSPFGETPLPTNTPLVNETTYYASQTINGCESPYRLPVIVKITSSLDEIVPINLVYSPNPVIDVLNIKSSIELKFVKVSNLLGQILIEQRFNSDDIKLNMSDVPIGTYFVIVGSDNKKETFKILKK